ncbi:UDP-N-acetyl-D-galactosamine dehydrogenase [Armatimonadetes bacterium GBS]|jgi:UDP-N-acetyl-D-galactosamine dehydrogenase|nr:UDP-N-acetyl-D-glucosamine 6-dehydrogenase [bacterium HR14]GIV13434.1 MAG: UDP-N-acetyl-D-galactosamine dehydrogenase [Fimbriimonadales bacterium]CUU10547.1 UDP-N-acetyl-D-galactosamine dehydrogenase [Armatimonadetes bacterium GBS]CUU36059.1 UDP-N-acetyl-D-galactosamine dehydrogenase [Armatimonadetes bacterium GXS]
MKAPETVAIVGLGYVGLPLAVGFAKHLRTIGYDVSHERVAELQQGYDRNGETPEHELRQPSLIFTSDPSLLREADVIIVTVPTPVDKAKRPDLRPLLSASRTVGQHMKRGAIVVYESTVYPGCTEEDCVPVLEEVSGMKCGVDFKVGYSPERINPGDPEHTLETIVKVVAGQDEATTELLANLYGLVVKAGIHKAPNIRTAEAAKVIENTQRDLNIALMNELALLFHRLGLNTRDVLSAARTKWNFLPFEPGLVGGHCIPVDPYYLTHKAQEIGFHPEVILAGRRVNDQMGIYVASETVKLLIHAGRSVQGAKVLVLGVAFKENVPDVRDTRVRELIEELQSFGCDVEAHDPLVLVSDRARFKARFIENPFETRDGIYEAVVLTVPHRVFRERPLEDYLRLLRPSGQGVFVDVRGVYLDAFRNLQPPPPVLYWNL